MDPLERLSEQLSRPWGVVSHLKGVRDSDELRKAYDDMQPKVVGASLRIGEGQEGKGGRERPETQYNQHNSGGSVPLMRARVHARRTSSSMIDLIPQP